MGRKVTIAAPRHPLNYMTTHLGPLAASDRGAMPHLPSRSITPGFPR